METVASFPAITIHPSHHATLPYQAAEKKVADAEARKITQAARAWKEYTEDRGGKVYYYNSQTKVSSYTKPAGFK